MKFKDTPRAQELKKAVEECAARAPEWMKGWYAKMRISDGSLVKALPGLEVVCDTCEGKLVLKLATPEFLLKMGGPNSSIPAYDSGVVGYCQTCDKNRVWVLF